MNRNIFIKSTSATLALAPLGGHIIESDESAFTKMFTTLHAEPPGPIHFESPYIFTAFQRYTGTIAHSWFKGPGSWYDDLTLMVNKYKLIRIGTSWYYNSIPKELMWEQNINDNPNLINFRMVSVNHPTIQMLYNDRPYPNYWWDFTIGKLKLNE